MKTCKKCGYIGDDTDFVPRGYTCKSCANARCREYNKKWYADSNNREIKLKQNSKYNKEHPEQIKASCRRHYEKHTEEVNERSLIWRKSNYDKSLESSKVSNRKRRVNNPEKFYEIDKNHRIKRSYLKRGPINNKSSGLVYHHFLYNNSYDIDPKIGGFIPVEIHKKSHGLDNPLGLLNVNILATKWIMDNSDDISIKEKAKYFYDKYLNMFKLEFNIHCGV